MSGDPTLNKLLGKPTTKVDDREAARVVRVALLQLLHDRTEGGPFYVSMLRQMKVITGNAAIDYVPTACVFVLNNNMGFGLAVNPFFFEKLSEEQRIGVLKHEILHLINRHPMRGAEVREREGGDESKGGTYVHRRANLAMDAVVNQYISENYYWRDPNPVLPETLDLPRMIGDDASSQRRGTFEEYYEILKKREADQPPPPPSPPPTTYPTHGFFAGSTVETLTGQVLVELLQEGVEVLALNRNKMIFEPKKVRFVAKQSIDFSKPTQMPVPSPDPVTGKVTMNMVDLWPTLASVELDNGARFFIGSAAEVGMLWSNNKTSPPQLCCDLVPVELYFDQYRLPEKIQSSNFGEPRAKRVSSVLASYDPVKRGVVPVEMLEVRLAAGGPQGAEAMPDRRGALGPSWASLPLAPLCDPEEYKRVISVERKMGHLIGGPKAWPAGATDLYVFELEGDLGNAIVNGIVCEFYLGKKGGSGGGGKGPPGPKQPPEPATDQEIENLRRFIEEASPEEFERVLQEARAMKAQARAAAKRGKS